MSWRSASTCGSSPCSRSASLVTGPMLTSRPRRADPSPPRLETRNLHGRGRGERHVVGGRAPRPAAPRSAARPPSRRARRRRPRRPARAARRAARPAPRRRGPPAPALTGRRRAPRPAPRPRTARAAPRPRTTPSTQRRRRSRADRGDPHAGQGPRIEPGAASRIEQQPHPVRARQADQVVAGRPTTERPVERRRSGSPAPRPRPAPSDAQPAASPLACARARVTATVKPASGRAARENQASRSCNSATRPTTTIAGARPLGSAASGRWCPAFQRPPAGRAASRARSPRPARTASRPLRSAAAAIAPSCRTPM